MVETRGGDSKGYDGVSGIMQQDSDKSHLKPEGNPIPEAIRCGRDLQQGIRLPHEVCFWQCGMGEGSTSHGVHTLLQVQS